MPLASLIYQGPTTQTPAPLAPSDEIDPLGQGTPLREATEEAAQWRMKFEGYTVNFAELYPHPIADPEAHNAEVARVQALIDSYAADRRAFDRFTAHALEVSKATTHNVQIIIDLANQAADKNLLDDAAELAAIAEELNRRNAALVAALDSANAQAQEAQAAQKAAANRANVNAYNPPAPMNWQNAIVTVAVVLGSAFVLGRLLAR